MKHRPAFDILGSKVQPGKTERLHLEIAKLLTNTPIHVPVIVHHAKKDGPILLLLAGSHGDEINGIDIVRKVMKKGWNKPEQGTVICIPVYNIFGFLNLRREFPDGRDLNRSFPGSKNGSLAAQFAHQFMTEIAPYVDVIIDFHTGAAQRSNFPQTRCDFKSKKSLELCKKFGAPFILNSPLISKSMRAAVQKMGKDYILFEGGKANQTDPEIVEFGLTGVQRIMKTLNMKAFTVEDPEEAPILLKSSKWIRASNSGMFAPKVKNGSYVKQGDLLGKIADPFGNFERLVKTSSSGFIININEGPLVNKGDAIFHLGLE